MELSSRSSLQRMLNIFRLVSQPSELVARTVLKRAPPRYIAILPLILLFQSCFIITIKLPLSVLQHSQRQLCFFIVAKGNQAQKEMTGSVNQSF